MAEEGVTPHEAEAAEARASRDPERIKALYTSLGADLLSAYGSDGFDLVQHGSGLVARWQAEKFAATTPGERFLDLGCGPRPEVSLQMARSGRTIVCVDLGWELVALARKIAAEEGVAGLVFVSGDAEALPFRQGAFDVVVADDIIEHVPRPDALVSECGRVVTDAGIVSISTPNRRALSVLVDRLRDLARGRIGPPEKYFLVPSHLTEFTRRQLRGMSQPFFDKVGFVAEGWDGDETVKRLSTAITRRGPLRFLGRHWIVQLQRPRRP